MLRRLAPVLAVVVLGACTAPAHSPPAPERTSSTTTSSAPSATPSPTDRTPRVDPGLVDDLEAVRDNHPGAEIAVALAPVGSGTRPRVVGRAPTLVAWSTIKVPLALAVLRADLPGTAADVEAALTASDNAAAERLWEELGAGEEASAAVEEQLRRGGDRRTRVPAERTEPGYSVFGQTRWRLGEQARFTAALPCLRGARPVTDAMGRVVSGQRWGLGRLEGPASRVGGVRPRRVTSCVSSAWCPRRRGRPPRPCRCAPRRTSRGRRSRTRSPTSCVSTSRTCRPAPAGEWRPPGRPLRALWGVPRVPGVTNPWDLRREPPPRAL